MALEVDGYAFPGTRYSQEGMPIGVGQGMTMRDWFAGQALAGNIARDDRPKMAAKSAYEIADAMLAERNAE